MTPTPDRFRALARSSPWRFHTLRFTFEVRRDASPKTGSPDPTPLELPVRAWLRRPDRLRVENLDGRLVRVVRKDAATAGVLVAGGGRGRDHTLRWPNSIEPERDADGFVRRRPSDSSFDYEAPMHVNYRFVAMLDPVELADGDELDPVSQTHGGAADPGQPIPATDIEQVAVVDHHGRQAWEALLRPTSAYAPWCACCALLPSAQSRRREALENPDGLEPDLEPGLEHAEAHRVRLDVETGVCVLTEQVGGSNAGAGHEVIIESVDEVMADDLFARPKSRLRRLLRR